jgi:hypothetical protein
MPDRAVIGPGAQGEVGCEKQRKDNRIAHPIHPKSELAFCREIRRVGDDHLLHLPANAVLPQ